MSAGELQNNGYETWHFVLSSNYITAKQQQENIADESNANDDGFVCIYVRQCITASIIYMEMYICWTMYNCKHHIYGNVYMLDNA